MMPGDTPAVARRTVRLAIRDARTARGLTQTQVAEQLADDRGPMRDAGVTPQVRVPEIQVGTAQFIALPG